MHAAAVRTNSSMKGLKGWGILVAQTGDSYWRLTGRASSRRGLPDRRLNGVRSAPLTGGVWTDLVQSRSGELSVSSV